MKLFMAAMKADLSQVGYDDVEEDPGTCMGAYGNDGGGL
jgi:hypothetical protein